MTSIKELIEEASKMNLTTMVEEFEHTEQWKAFLLSCQTDSNHMLNYEKLHYAQIWVIFQMIADALKSKSGTTKVGVKEEVFPLALKIFSEIESYMRQV